MIPKFSTKSRPFIKLYSAFLYLLSWHEISMKEGNYEVRPGGNIHHLELSSPTMPMVKILSGKSVIGEKFNMPCGGMGKRERQPEACEALARRALADGWRPSKRPLALWLFGVLIFSCLTLSGQFCACEPREYRRSSCLSIKWLPIRNPPRLSHADAICMAA